MAKMPFNFKKKSVNADDDLPVKGKKHVAKKHVPPAKKAPVKKRK